MKCAEMFELNAYDGQHRRVRTVVNGDTLWYFNAPSGQVLSEYDDSGWVSDFIYLNGQPLARIDAGGTLYFINDHLGTPLMLIDDSATVQWSADWYPFGTIYDEVVSSENDIRFPGQWRDTVSGLYYNWHRYYDPELGRYRQPDPIRMAGGSNLYAYAGCSPTKNVDLTGLIWNPPYEYWGFIYHYADSLVDWGRRTFQGENTQRHCVVSCILASTFGTGVARGLGIANEIRGFIGIDLPAIFRGDRFHGQGWAFEWEDLASNELGIAATDRNCIKRNPNDIAQSCIDRCRGFSIREPQR